MIKGTKSDLVSDALKHIAPKLRHQVKEITLDMAASMVNICNSSFPIATQVTDRFHVQKLAYEAFQDLRIMHRWSALDEENEAIQQARKKGVTYTPQIFSNGDTIRQLLARSRHLLFKHQSKWTINQEHRARILFDRFPDIQKTYQLSMKLFNIYQNIKCKGVAYTKLAQWYNDSWI